MERGWGATGAAYVAASTWALLPPWRLSWWLSTKSSPPEKNILNPNGTLVCLMGLYYCPVALEKYVATKDVEIGALHTSVEAKDAEIVKLQNSVAMQAVEIEELKAKIAELE